MRNVVIATIAVVLSLSSFGCDKLRKGSGDDGGASASSGGGAGGIVSKALSLVTPGGDPFEGDIVLSMKEGTTGKSETIDYEVKGDKLRFDAPSASGKGGYVVFNGAEKKMYMIDDAKKQAIVMDLGKMEASAPTTGPHATGGGGTGTSDEDFSIDMSGGTDVVAGYACDVWKVTETNKTTHKVRKTDACLAKGIGFPDMGMSSGKKSWMSKLVTDKFFPLRAVTTEDGVEKSRMEATKIDKKTLAAARFEVPAGYTVIDMSDLMKGLGGMGAGGMGGMHGMGAPPH